MNKSIAIHDKDEVSALARGLSLVRAVANASQPLSNRDLVEATGIPKATVSRLVATLVAAGYFKQDSGSERYALGSTVLDLGNAYLRHFDFRNQARLHLAELAEAAGANVHLGIQDGLDIVLIDTLKPRSALILSRMDVGSRMSIATSASGRAYLACLPQDQQATLMNQLLAVAPHQSKLKVRLKQALTEHAQLGFCTSFGEWHPDIHALGFTLRGPQGELYAVSCGGPAFMLPKEMMLKKIGPKILQTQRAIAKETGAEATLCAPSQPSPAKGKQPSRS